MSEVIESKAAFARRCNVDRSRVSQWISEGKIGPGELFGTGPHAKIRVEAAQQKLKLKLDVGQRLGNGLKTRLSNLPEKLIPSTMFGELVMDRLVNWRQIHLENGRTKSRSIDEMAAVLGKEPSIVLDWLRAGAPYLKEGDWENGEGFRLCSAHIIDWTIAMHSDLECRGESGLIRRLGL